MSESIQSPTFSLAACPMCSSLGFVVRPEWRCARHTSARSGKRHVIWAGCGHSPAIQGADRPVAVDGPEIAANEAHWAAEAERLFAQRTATWTDPHRNAFRFALRDKATLLGATDSMDFPPDVPAQQPEQENQ